MTSINRKLDKIAAELTGTDADEPLESLVVPLQPQDFKDGTWRSKIPPTIRVGGRDYVTQDGKVYEGPAIAILAPDDFGSDTAGSRAGEPAQGEDATRDEPT